MMATPATTWMKLARRLGWDGNRLRRRSDLIEAWLVPAAIAIFLILCPLVFALAGLLVHADNAAVRQAQRSWRPVTAVLLQAVPGPEESDGGANTWMEWTKARWVVDGRQHVGEVPAGARSTAGSTETIWLNRAGTVQLPALTAAQVADQVDADAAIALAGIAVVLALLSALARRALERQRLAGWELEWLAVGPRWSHQD